MPLRILIADTQPLFRRCLRALIEREPDMEVVGSVRDVDELLDVVASIPCDVVCMDVSLAKVSAIETMRQLRRVAPAAKVVAVTDQVDWHNMRDMVAAGAVGYVSKSSAPDHLFRAIRTGSAVSRYFCEIAKDCVMHLVFAAGTSLSTGAELTPREREVLGLVAAGRTSSEIAASLELTPATVRSYRSAIMRNLNLHSKSELTRYAIRNGVLAAAGAASC
jgi:DNA-binding NarL/FixJ family response regulator